MPAVTRGQETAARVPKASFTMRSVEGSRRRAAAVVALATAILVGGGTVAATAQVGGPLPTVPGSPPSTQAPPSTTTPRSGPSTTSTTSPQLLPNPGAAAGNDPTTTTTAPRSTTTAPPAPLPPASGDGAPTNGAGAFPPQLQAMVDSVVRTKANNTAKLVAALAPLAAYGLDDTNRAIVGFGRFPVAGLASWSDDWWFPRFGPGWRLHEGLDIFAAYGTPVRAPVDGIVRVTDSGIGGLAVYVIQPNRTYWYMCHLSGLGAGIAEGVTVKTGQVVGYVGDSGNARGGAPHLHFEIHPNGGPAVPPKPVVDRFVSDALALVPQLIDAYAKSGLGAEPVALPEPELPTITPRAALLWASAANPTGGTLRLVEADARAAAGRIDWTSVAEAAAARTRAEEQVGQWLRPLVPAALARAAGI